MDYTVEYDKNDPISIETYSQRIIGKTFQQVLDSDDSDDIENKANKGDLGQLVERHHFHYKCNNDSNPDFVEAGVELKVTPFKRNNDGTYSAKERLVLTKINYNDIVHEPFYDSHMWRKAKLILLIYYLYQKDVKKKYDYQIKHSKLYTPPEEDILIIRKDYEIIVEKVKSGRAHELSERDTMYLSACTKGAKSTDRTSQPYSDILAKPRAFAYKTSYMTYVLNMFVIPGRDTYIPFADNKELVNGTVEDAIIRRLSAYEGMYENQILSKLHLELNPRDKGKDSVMICNMLGVRSTRIEEFAKAGIVIKVVKYRKNKGDNQEFRLEDFKFKTLDEEKFDDEVLDEETLEPIGWEYSELYDYLKNRKYLLAVFWEDNKGNIFKGCQLWGMPDKDVEIVHSVWKELKAIVRRGVRLQKKKVGGKYIVENNLPGISHNGIFHIRPHANQSYYILSDGSTVGSGRLGDTDILPDGQRMTKQAYWLNRSYIDSQIDANLRRDYSRG